jgi:hypothetical protein
VLKSFNSGMQNLQHEERLIASQAIMINEQLAQAIRAQKACEALQQQAMCYDPTDRLVTPHTVPQFPPITLSEQSTVFVI